MPIFVTEDAYLCIQRCLSSSGKKGINFSKEITAIFPGINTILKKKINRHFFRNNGLFPIGN